MQVVLGEVGGNADQPRRTPFDLIGGFLAVAVAHQQLEVAAMVHQPVQVEQALINHVLRTVALVFDDHRIAVLVEAQGIHAPAMAGDILGGEKAHAQQGI
ncbi:hypothetical protein D9M69_484120 [compost metagenome]